MTNVFLASAIIAVVYFSYRFIEMRFVTKQAQPLRNLVKDSIVVYLCAVAGDFVIRQFQPLLGDAKVEPQVFVNEPNF